MAGRVQRSNEFCCTFIIVPSVHMALLLQPHACADAMLNLQYEKH